MSGRRAKSFRRMARMLNGGHAMGRLVKVQHRPCPLIDLSGRLIGQAERCTVHWEGYRQIYQALKRRWIQTPRRER